MNNTAIGSDVYIILITPIAVVPKKSFLLNDYFVKYCVGRIEYIHRYKGWQDRKVFLEQHALTWREAIETCTIRAGLPKDILFSYLVFLVNNTAIGSDVYIILITPIAVVPKKSFLLNDYFVKYCVGRIEYIHRYKGWQDRKVFLEQHALIWREAIETCTIRAGLPKDILFSYTGALKPFKLCFSVAAIRVRIVNLVSVIGYCIEYFYSAHKGIQKASR